MSDNLEIELIEIRNFLALYPPFDRLDEPEMNRLPQQLQIRYFRQQSTLPDLQALLIVGSL